MLHICRVSKTLGEWYQKTNKTEDKNKLTLLAFKIIAILHNYMVGNVYKASGNFADRFQKLYEHCQPCSCEGWRLF
jgi:hypothetical protein